MENREEERKLLDAAGVEGRVLSMKDGGQEVGYAIVDLQEGTLLLRKLAAKGYDFTQRPQEHHCPLRAGRALKPENPARCLPVS